MKQADQNIAIFRVIINSIVAYDCILCC